MGQQFLRHHTGNDALSRSATASGRSPSTPRGRFGLTLEVNDVRRQNGSTATMIFDVWHIVHYPAMLP